MNFARRACTTKYASWVFHAVICFSLVAVLASGGCSKEDSALVDGSTANGKPQVFAVNYPLAFFAQEIGGNDIDVRFPIPPDVDPAFWKPDAETVSLFQQADCILLNGANYARWTKLVSLPESKGVNTSSAAKSQYIELEQAVTHQHGPDGEHSHADFAFTTWLDFQLAVVQARAVKDALIELLPDRATELNERFAAIEAKLNGLDEALSTVDASSVPIVCSHPVYQYLARRYGLNTRSVHWEPDQMPDETAWKELQTLLAAHPAKYMLWEAEPLPDVRAKLSDMGISVVVFAPAGNTPSEGDFYSVMQQNLSRLKAVLDP